MADKNYGNDSQLAELVKYISDEMKFPIMGAGGGFAPIGTINFFDATVAPLGWLACDGSTHNISDYPDLATFYASQHGASNFYGGNGTTTFAVPNLQGEFLRGAGTNGHTNQGNGGSVGEHQDATEINNTIQDSYIVNYANGDSVRHSNQTSTGTTSPYTNNRDIFTTRPTNTSFLICVKATVAGDPNAHHYSTEEQVVGKWIDGRDLYEKTIDISSVSIPANWKRIAAIGTDCIINSIDGFFDNGAHWPLISPYGTELNTITNFQENGTIYMIANGGSVSGHICITVRYTKTS